MKKYKVKVWITKVYEIITDGHDQEDAIDTVLEELDPDEIERLGDFVEYDGMDIDVVGEV